MRTSKRIEESFRRELGTLLDKYKAEIEMVEVGDPYLERNMIAIYIPSKCNADGEMVDEYTEFFL